MSRFTFDLEDGLPPVSFTLNENDTDRFRAFMSECNQDQQDAARYRGLRKLLYGPAFPVGEAYITMRVVGACPSTKEIDAAIDAALSAAPAAPADGDAP